MITVTAEQIPRKYNRGQHVPLTAMLALSGLAVLGIAYLAGKKLEEPAPPLTAIEMQFKTCALEGLAKAGFSTTQELRSFRVALPTGQQIGYIVSEQGIEVQTLNQNTLVVDVLDSESSDKARQAIDAGNKIARIVAGCNAQHG